jgi:hypothetical protein
MRNWGGGGEGSGRCQMLGNGLGLWRLIIYYFFRCCGAVNIFFASGYVNPIQLLHEHFCGFSISFYHRQFY